MMADAADVLDDGDRLELWRATGAELVSAATLTGRVDAVGLAWDGRRIAFSRDDALHVVDGAGVERTTAAIVNAYDKVVAIGFAGDDVFALRDFGAPLHLVGDHLDDEQTGRLGPPWAELPDRLVANTGEVAPGALDAYVPPVGQRAPTSAVAWTPAGDRLLAFAPDALYVASAGGVDAVATATSGSVRRVAFRTAGAAQEVWWVDGYGQLAARGLEADAAERRVTNTSLFALSRDGARVVVQPSPTEPIEIRDVATDKVVDTVRIRDPFDLANPVPADRGGLAANDRLLVVGGDDHAIAWDLARHAIAWSVAEPLVAVTPDARLVLTIAQHGVRATEVDARRDLGVLDVDVGHGAWSDEPATDRAAIAVSPDGALAAIGTRRGTVEIVDLAAWKLVRSIAVHATEVTAVAWRPDGKLIATASRGGLVAVVQPDGTLRATLALDRRAPSSGHGDALAPAAWLALFPDGTARGPATGAAAVWVCTVPVGIDVGAPPPPVAPATAWTSLFE